MKTLNTDKQAPSKIMVNFELIEQRIKNRYVCPEKNLMKVKKMCRNLKFRNWKKAAYSLYRTGYYTISKSFADGGGFDIYVMTKGKRIIKMFEKVHNRQLDKILKIVVESRLPKNIK